MLNDQIQKFLNSIQILLLKSQMLRTTINWFTHEYRQHLSNNTSDQSLEIHFN